MRKHNYGFLFLLPALSTSAIQAAAPDGQALYKQHCAVCHDSSRETRAPEVAALRRLTAEAVLASMKSGTMVPQASVLNEDEKRAVAEFLSAKKLAAPGQAVAQPSSACPANPAMGDPEQGSRWDGWGNGVAGNHFQNAAAAGITADSVKNLKLKWAFGFPDGTLAFAQPSAYAGRLFVGSDKGGVYSLDAKTGCTYWSYRADAGVRTAISVGKIRRSGTPAMAAYFGDIKANVYAVNAQTGDLLWKVQADDHAYARITGAPAFFEGRLYVPVSSVEEVAGANPRFPCCTFRGSVIALDGASGRVLWKSYTIAREPKEVKKNKQGVPLYHPAGAAIWSGVTIDEKRRVALVGTGNAYTEPADDASDAVIAFDLASGSRAWIKQVQPNDAFVIGCQKGNENCPAEVGPDFDFGNSPMLRDLPGGKRILTIGQKSGVMWGLDPDRQGEIVWQTRVSKGGALGGLEWGSATDENNVYAPISDRTNRATAGGLWALKLATGEKVWAAPPVTPECKDRWCQPTQSAAIAVIPGVVFSGAVDGHMRAYSTKDGAILWDFNTIREYTTVNGVKGKGGSIDSAGPIIVNGMLYTNSGYALWGGAAGNVLLAFGLD